MAQTVIKAQPVKLAGLWRLKILLPEAKELLDVMGKLRRTGRVEKDEQIFDTLERDFAYGGGFSEGTGAVKDEVY